MEVYPELEEEGGIDGWGGSESLSVLANLAVSFADPISGIAHVLRGRRRLPASSARRKTSRRHQTNLGKLLPGHVPRKKECLDRGVRRLRELG